MEKVLHTSVEGARELLLKELRGIVTKHKIEAHPVSVDYLVDLIVRYMTSDNFFVKNADGKLGENFLVDLYASYLQGTPEVRRAALQRLGDICLLVTGFFSDSLKKKIIDVDYYFGMGGSAYWQLSLSHVKEVKHLYAELSQKFRPFSNVLGEVSDRSGLHNNSDLLRIYERWLLTGSDHLKALLSEHGISTPVPIEIKTKH